MDKYDESEKLEKLRMEYLEANDKRNARRIETKIIKIKNELELNEFKKVKKELSQYKNFIREKDMKKQFEDYCTTEYILECARNGDQYEK